MKLNPEDTYNHLLLGGVYECIGDYEGAATSYKQAIKLDNRQHEFYFSIARSYYKLDDINNSQKYLQLAKTHSQDNNDELLYQSKIDKLSAIN